MIIKQLNKMFYIKIITLLEFLGKLIFPLITAKATESPRS